MIPLNQRRINIDTSNKCTLQCPGCRREDFRRNGLPIPGEELTIDQFDKITNFFKQVSFCGTFSDPIFNRHFLDILKMCKSKNIKTRVYTAASHKPEKWYKEAFKVNTDAKWLFGIDGLPEESHKYRINQDGRKLFNMMLLAIAEGIKVEWQYLIFDYNKDSIIECKELALKHGIKFTLCASNRFKISDYLEQPRKPVAFKEGDYNLKPKQEQFVTTNDTAKSQILNPKCMLADRSMSYTNEGNIMPCCWTNTVNYQDNPEFSNEALIKLTKKKLHIDNNKSVDDILNSDEWKDFWDLLKNNPQNAPDRCKQMCSGPINENVEMDLYEG